MRRLVTIALASITSLMATPASAEDKLPIAVMELAARGVDVAAAGALTTEVSNTLATLRVFRVITREDIQRMLQLEQTKQQCTGTVDAACMAEIGGALGVDYLIYGEVAKIAETYSVSLVLLDIGKAQAANRVNKKVTDPRDLLDETELSTKLLVQPLLADKKGYLIVDTREGGAKVTIDGRLLGITPLPGRLELEMGAHEMVVEKEGFLVYAKTIDVAPNQANVEQVALVPSQTFIEGYESTARLTRIFAWGTAALAAALVGTGIVLRLVDDARFDDLIAKGYITQQASICAESNPSYNGTDYCPTPRGYENGVVDDIHSIETADSAALAIGIVGGASALVSVFLFLIGDDPDRYESYGTVAPAVAVTPGGVRFSF
jgi:TolB-like protein